jgi:predicted RNase H-like HicB family nuclease
MSFDIVKVKRLLAAPEVIWERDDEGTEFYVARQPDLPGCMAQGSTPDEALASLEEARDLCLTVMSEERLPLPPALQERLASVPA